MHVRRDETCAASTLQIVPSSTQAEDLLRLRARSIRLGMTRWRAVSGRWRRSTSRERANQLGYGVDQQL